MEDKDARKSERVMQAVLQMKKLEIKRLQEDTNRLRNACVVVAVRPRRPFKTKVWHPPFALRIC